MLTNRHLKTTIALILALSAIAAPAANATLLRGDPLCSGCSYSVASQPASRSSIDAPPTIVRVESKSGFHWADAGIGAAGLLAIALVALGLTLAVRSARPAPARQRSTSSRAPGIQ